MSTPRKLLLLLSPVLPLSLALSLTLTVATPVAHAEAPAAPGTSNAGVGPASKSPATAAASKTTAVPVAAVPAALTPPATAKVLRRLHATGAQVYGCAAVADAPGKLAWTLKQPDATLTDSSGAAAGTHGAGPTWTAKDGSSVSGKKQADAPSPQADAVPWLLLGATAHTGQGLFSKVTFVQRLNTSGGKAPAAGCDAAAVGAEKRVPYSADYVFFE